MRSDAVVVRNENVAYDDVEVKQARVFGALSAPWLIGKHYDIPLDAGIHAALHLEVLPFQNHMRPIETETSARINAIETMEFITKTLWPESAIQLYGSYAYGIDLPSGDIDMCLVGTPSVDENGIALKPLHILDKLANNLRTLKPFVKCVKLIEARVPVVKVTLFEGDIHCDICGNNMAVLKTVDTIRGYIARFPALKPLTLVLKFFMGHRGLGATITGGLSSFGTFLMCLSHLQMYRTNFPDETEESHDLGTMLANFFYFYGYMFNICTTGINVKRSGYYNRHEVFGPCKPRHYKRYSIMDLNDETNQVGIDSKGGFQIRDAFREAYSILSEIPPGEQGSILLKLFRRGSSSL